MPVQNKGWNRIECASYVHAYIRNGLRLVKRNTVIEVGVHTNCVIIWNIYLHVCFRNLSSARFEIVTQDVTICNSQYNV